MGLLLAVFICGFGFGFYGNRDNRIFNAFALTARMEMPTYTLGKSGTVPFFAHQTVQPNYFS